MLWVVYSSLQTIEHAQNPIQSIEPLSKELQDLESQRVHSEPKLWTKNP